VPLSAGTIVGFAGDDDNRISVAPVCAPGRVDKARLPGDVTAAPFGKR